MKSHHVQATLALLGAACLSAAHAAPAYRMTDLGAHAEAWSINMSGEIAGTDATGQVAVYRNGGWQPVHAPSAGCNVVGIDSAGEMAGSCPASDGGTLAIEWDAAGQAAVLLPAGTHGTALGMSGNGTISGMMVSDAGDLVPYVWTQGVVKRIPDPPHGSDVVIQGVNDFGQVAGQAIYDTWFYPVATYWTGRGWNELGGLGGDTSWATFINNAGHVVGQSDKYWERHVHGFIANDQNMVDLRTLGGRDNRPMALNNLDVVVGRSTDPKFVVHGFVWIAGQIYRLDRHVADAPADLVITSANGVNDAGAIVGKATFGGLSHAVLLTSVPK